MERLISLQQELDNRPTDRSQITSLIQVIKKIESIPLKTLNADIHLQRTVDVISVVRHFEDVKRMNIDWLATPMIAAFFGW